MTKSYRFAIQERYFRAHRDSDARVHARVVSVRLRANEAMRLRGAVRCRRRSESVSGRHAEQPDRSGEIDLFVVQLLAFDRAAPAASSDRLGSGISAREHGALFTAEPGPLAFTGRNQRRVWLRGDELELGRRTRSLCVRRHERHIFRHAAIRAGRDGRERAVARVRVVGRAVARLRDRPTDRPLGDACMTANETVRAIGEPHQALARIARRARVRFLRDPSGQATTLAAREREQQDPPTPAHWAER